MTIPSKCGNLDFFSRYDRINPALSRFGKAFSETLPGLPFPGEELFFEAADDSGRFFAI
jgi:hypothetical protein